MIGHPREDTLLAFQDHRLDDQRRRRLAGHLSGCQRCRNVVQAHRTVRGVFALEAPFAPDGVLERALASRAAGMIVMLPVAEAGTRKRIELPSRGFLIAAGMVLTVGVGLQAFPAERLQGVWGAWGAVIAAWEPSLGRAGFSLSYPAAPLARPAVFDHTRLRPMSVNYTVSSQNFYRGVEEDSTSYTFRMVLARDSRGWVVSEFYSEVGPSLQSHFDSLTLGVTQWVQYSRWGKSDSAAVLVNRFVPRQDHAEVTTSWIGRPAPHLVRQHPAGTELSPLEVRFTHPRWVGEGHRSVQFMALQLEPGWAGSMAEFSGRSVPWIGARLPVTYIVTDEERLTTPIGTFDTWVVEELSLDRTYEQGFNIRKSDGLLLRSYHRYPWSRMESVITAVTYP